MKFEILVADDHAIIRDGLKKILADTDDLEVVGEAGDGSATLQKVRERDWDLVILDLSMPGRRGRKVVSGRTDEARIPSCSTPWSRRFATPGRSFSSSSGSGTQMSPSYIRCTSTIFWM